uniref:Uncharacterized protein n=1 Tax=Cannabis sativa TaxID=3483 RepID=A0A803PTB5_CANSA
MANPCVSRVRDAQIQGAKETCFQCGLVGHFKKSPIEEGITETRGKTHSSSGIAITQMDAATSPFVVRGQLPINDSYYTVLFDFGATHSYVAS